MGRLIDADVLKKDLTRFYDGEVVARKLIDEQPTVDAVPVRHGRWIWRNYPGYQYQCDQCKRWAIFESKFCPECGALMKWWKDGDNGKTD